MAEVLLRGNSFDLKDFVELLGTKNDGQFVVNTNANSSQTTLSRVNRGNIFTRKNYTQGGAANVNTNFRTRRALFTALCGYCGLSENELQNVEVKKFYDALGLNDEMTSGMPLQCRDVKKMIDNLLPGNDFDLDARKKVPNEKSVCSADTKWQDKVKLTTIALFDDGEVPASLPEQFRESQYLDCPGDNYTVTRPLTPDEGNEILNSFDSSLEDFFDEVNNFLQQKKEKTLDVRFPTLRKNLDKLLKLRREDLTKSVGDLKTGTMSDRCKVSFSIFSSYYEGLIYAKRLIVGPLLQALKEEP